MDSGAAPEPPANVPPQSHSPERAEATPRQRPRGATHLVASDMSVFERLPRHRRDAEGLGSFAFLYHGTVASRAEALFSAFRLVTMV